MLQFSDRVGAEIQRCPHFLLCQNSSKLGVLLRGFVTLSAVPPPTVGRMMRIYGICRISLRPASSYYFSLAAEHKDTYAHLTTQLQKVVCPVVARKCYFPEFEHRCLRPNDNPSLFYGT